MSGIDKPVILQWVWSIFAKLLLAAFLSPFVLIGTAAAFAIGASRAGTVVGVGLAAGFVSGIAFILERWIQIIPKRKSGDDESQDGSIS